MDVQPFDQYDGYVYTLVEIITAKNVAEWVIITKPRDIHIFASVYPRLQVPPAEPMITGNRLLAPNDFSIILLRILSLLGR